MIELSRETNVEVLREFGQILVKTVERLTSEVAALKNSPPGEQPWLGAEMRDELHRLQKKFYGCGREKLPKGKESRPVGHRGQDLLIHTGRTNDEGAEAIPAIDEEVKSLPLAKLHDFSDEGLTAESKSFAVAAGHEAWKEMNGFYQESTEITVTERVYTKVVHRQKKYRLKDEFNKTGKEVIITAPGPVKVRPGSSYSVEFALSVVLDKYEFHLPLERQRRKMESAGFEVDVKTLYGLCEAVALHCESVLPKIRADILADYCAVHLDETPWRILETKTNGYFWVMSNRVGSYYQFEPTRSGKVPLELLKGYDGAVVTDAYGGYNRLDKKPTLRIGHCWAHARREFYDRYDDFPTECREAIERIDKILDIEHKAKTLEELRVLRSTESKAAVAEYLEFLYKTKPKFLSTEGISKAIQYSLNQWKGLTHFLNDLTVPLTNNDAERALRHLVVGRKNFLGSKTINGADTAAALYTVIESCKKSSVRPTEYLTYLITERWHKREPLSPRDYGALKLGPNKKIAWPARSEWEINPPELPG
jgi:transposase